MFKIPEKIKIGFVDYRIEEINRLSGEKTVIGEHFEEHACIQLAQHLAPSTKAKVLIHECLHAVMAQYGICVDEEERLIGQLSTGITEMIDQIVGYAVSETLKECSEHESRKYIEENQVLSKVISDSHRLLAPLVVDKNLKTEEFNQTPSLATGTLFKSHIRMTEYTNWLIKKLIDNSKEKS